MRYVAELEQNGAVADLRVVIREHPVVTLVYGAKDEQHNHAIVLADFVGQ